GLADTAYAQIRVTNVDRAPVVSAPAAVSGSEGARLTVMAAASDPDQDAIGSLDADLSRLPPGDAAFTRAPGGAAGTLAWTPRAGDRGSYPVDFVASAGGLSDTTTTLITVSDALPPSAALTVTSSLGDAPLSITTNASGSSDPDGIIVS